jgi:hypothetical protein
MRTLVREIFHKGSVSVVEWRNDNGDVQRVVLPTSELVREHGETFVDDIAEGQDYGVAWEDLIHTKVGPKAIAALLRNAGIWTMEDYARNTRVVTSVFNEACAINFQGFKEAILRQGKDE